MKKLEPLTKEKIKKEVLNRFKWKVDKKLEKIGDNNFIQTKHVVSLIKCFNDNLAKAIDLTIEKTTKDVKSAVQGLLKDIKKEIEKHKKKAKKADEKYDWEAREHELGIVDSLEIAKQKIKKWFGDFDEKD